MVRPIMRDPVFLAGKSESATEADKQVVQDLLDTLRANLRCGSSIPKRGIYSQSFWLPKGGL